MKLSDWKNRYWKELSESLQGRVSRGCATIGEEKVRLHAKIGHLTLDVDFLKKLKQLKIASD